VGKFKNLNGTKISNNKLSKYAGKNAKIKVNNILGKI